jgi:hypothetical protein
MANHNKTIAFRLHDALVTRLAAQAEERQMSVGEYARHIVIEHIGNGGTGQLLESLSENKKALEQLKTDLCVATATLLCNAGHAEPKEARNWVKANLGPVRDARQGGQT